MDLHPNLPLAKINGLKDHLLANVLGQYDAVSIVAAEAQNALFRLADPGMPFGCFLCPGPPGVGKTETAKVLAHYLYGNPTLERDHFVRFDMSEFQTQESLRVIIGGGPNERGTMGQYYDKARGYGVLLFDEIEKAHPRIIDIFLQIMNDGRITVAAGETLHLSQFFVFATTNIGSLAILNAKASAKETVKAFVTRLLRAELRPEIVDRMRVLVYQALGYDDQMRAGTLIVRREIERHKKTYGVDLSYDDELVRFLVASAYTPRAGMRPVRRLVGDLIRAALRDPLARDSMTSGQLIPDPAARCVRFLPFPILTT